MSPRGSGNAAQLQIADDDLSGPEIASFLTEHMADMVHTSPPESRHALDLDGLRQPGVRFWSAWLGDTLVGCGALKDLGEDHGEIKSMRTSPVHRGNGIASALLAHIVEQARIAGLERLSLETGSMEFFAPARALYLRHGFNYCSPFADYVADPNSVFMTRVLDN